MTGLLNQGALRSNQRVSRGRSRGVGGLSGGLWDNLWPYGFGLAVRRACHFQMQSRWDVLPQTVLNAENRGWVIQEAFLFQ